MPQPGETANEYLARCSKMTDAQSAVIDKLEKRLSEIENEIAAKKTIKSSTEENQNAKC